ncbi:MAG: rhodanese-like domain-containing protein [Elusimicrobia bacterium]|nr:rhodanese-like domain-containing protein [Elusimicrobiota bacterium]
MRRAWVAVLLAVPLLSAAGPVKRAKPRELDPREVQRLVKEEGAILVDVREQEERREVVPGSLSMPTTRSFDDRVWDAFAASLPKDKTIVFYCVAGVRAKKLAKKLSKKGFATGYFDGPEQWKAEGLAVQKGHAR